MSSTKSFIGIVEVFEVITHLLFTILFILLYRSFLISNLSTTASIIKSQLANLLKSSLIFPTFIRLALFLCMRAGGSERINFFTASSVMLLGVLPGISKSKTSCSEFAI